MFKAEAIVQTFMACVMLEVRLENNKSPETLQMTATRGEVCKGGTESQLWPADAPTEAWNSLWVAN